MQLRQTPRSASRFPCRIRCHEVRVLEFYHKISDLFAPDALMSMIGIGVAKMHLANIIHGDLTTSK